MPNHYTNILVCVPGHDFDVDAFNEKHRDTNFCEVVKPMPKELEGTKSPGDEPNWYDWQHDNWGIKWGTYATTAMRSEGDSRPVIITMITPWGPPNEHTMQLIIKHLCEEYQFEDVWVSGYDPGTASYEIHYIHNSYAKED